MKPSVETVTQEEIRILRNQGWRVYNSESVAYDFLAIRQVRGKPVTRRLKLRPSPIFSPHG
jgi:hypothetical protein